MDRGNHPWTVVNERKADGQCHHPEKADEEVTSRQDEDESWIFRQPNASVLYQTKARSKAALDSGRQATAALSLSEPHLTCQSASISVHRTGRSSAPALNPEIQDSGSYLHSLGRRQESVRLTASQDSSSLSTASTASTASQHNPNDYIPRNAESISVLLNTPDLFPHLQNDTIEKWVQICEPYRDRSYTGTDIDYFPPLNPEEIENGPLFKLITAVYKQQDTPCVENRQNHEQADEVENNEEDNGQSKTK